MSRKKYIRQSTLLVGSSLLKGVQVSDLKPNTTVRSFSGARADTIGEKLSKYNIHYYKTIILHVGDNDADNGADLDTFSDNYVSFLSSLSAKNRRIAVSGLLPRESVDLKPYNDTLKTICDENDLEFIDNHDNFLLASGEMPASYFQKDKLHLNTHDTRRLLSNINKVISVTKYTSRSNKPKHFKGSHPNINNTRHTSNGHRMSPKFYHICFKRGHSAQECYFNRRSTPRRDMNSW